jgi:tetratricopeptide (TPR) repeat protein
VTFLLHGSRHGASLVWVLAVSTAVLSSAAPLGAQQLPPKRGPDGNTAAGSTACPRFPKPVPPTPDQQAESRRLAQQGYEAALVGDHTQARDLLRRAAQLDLTSEQIAYRLGREHEEVEAPSDAVLEYCRYLSLAPKAPDAPDVRARIARLSPQQSATASDVAAVQFTNGVRLYERGQLNDAQTAFTQVLAANPDDASAHFNRGLVRAALGSPRPAIDDLERYLALQPQATDRPQVQRKIQQLERQTLSPGAAFGWGALIPGGGQYYTRRPWAGVAVGAAVLGGILFASRSVVESHTVDSVYQAPGSDSTYTQSVVVQERTYPNVGAGTAIAVSAALIGATEAYVYARRGRVGMAHPLPQANQRVGLSGAWQHIEPYVAPGRRRSTLVGAQLSF